METVKHNKSGKTYLWDGTVGETGRIGVYSIKDGKRTGPRRTMRREDVTLTTPPGVDTMPWAKTDVGRE